MKKLLTMALGLALCFTLSIPAFATWSHTLSEREPASEGMTSDEVLIQGQPGDVFYVGDLVVEIVSADEFDQAVSGPVPLASTGRWNIDLSGTSLSRDFEVTDNYPWAKVWINNQSSTNTVFSITRGSPTGTEVVGSAIKIAPHTATNVHATKPWTADTYYANFTNGTSGLKGTAACRVASSQAELDI